MSGESTPQTPQPTEMELLRAEMRAGFQSVSKRFDDVDTRFDTVDTRFDGVDTRLAGVDTRLAGIDTRLDGVDTRLAGIDTRLDGVDTRLAGIDTRLDGVDTHLGEHDNRFVSLEARITVEAAETRRHFDVVAEGLRESFKGVIDQTVATGRKVDRLIASNAVEHAAFLDAITDHDVRITRLEAAGQNPTSPATDRQAEGPGA